MRDFDRQNLKSFRDKQRECWHINNEMKTKIQEIFTLVNKLNDPMKIMSNLSANWEKEFDATLNKILFDMKLSTAKREIENMSTPVLNGLLEHWNEVKTLIEKEVTKRL